MPPKPTSLECCTLGQRHLSSKGMDSAMVRLEPPRLGRSNAKTVRNTFAIGTWETPLFHPECGKRLIFLAAIAIGVLILGGCMTVGTALNAAIPIAPERACYISIKVEMQSSVMFTKTGTQSLQSSLVMTGGFLGRKIGLALSPILSKDFKQKMISAIRAGASPEEAEKKVGPKTFDAYGGVTDWRSEKPCTSSSALTITVKTPEGVWEGLVPSESMHTRPVWGSYNIHITETGVTVKLQETGSKKFGGPAPGHWYWETLPMEVLEVPLRKAP